MCSFARLQRLYQVRPLRMLDTAKKRGVTLLYWMLAGGPLLARKVAGESFSGLGTDCTVKSARWSFVKKRRPVPPSGSPASSVKICTGISTLAPVLGITYFCHSVAKAAAGRRLKTKAASRRWEPRSVRLKQIIPVNFRSEMRVFVKQQKPPAGESRGPLAILVLSPGPLPGNAIKIFSRDPVRPKVNSGTLNQE